MTISSPVVRKPEPRRFHDHRVELKYVYLVLHRGFTACVSVSALKRLWALAHLGCLLKGHTLLGRDMYPNNEPRCTGLRLMTQYESPKLRGLLPLPRRFQADRG